MAGRHSEQDYLDNENSFESTGNSMRPGPNHPFPPNVANYRLRRYILPSGRAPPGFGGYGDEYEEDYEDEEGIVGGEEEYHAGASNDNPLYEVEDQESQFPDPSMSRQGQGSPKNNPLYGNDPFRPTTSAAMCMTAFLKPNKSSTFHSRYTSHSNPRQSSSSRTFVNTNDNGNEEIVSRSTRQQKLVCSPPQTFGKGLFQVGPGDQPIVRYPPARFSPILPTSSSDSSNQRASSPQGKHQMKAHVSSTANKLSIPPPQVEPPNIADLIAAVRSDKNLLLGEVRKHANREPRVPGDHDRYFAPRKGDIIIHFTPSLEDNKLLEYYDEKKSMLRLQPGDKLVRVKYDNYKLPDHLLITSKLYLYAPEWVYLGKALQTIKTV